jgi:hypothetical protein
MPMEDERVQILLKLLTARRFEASLLQAGFHAEDSPKASESAFPRRNRH